MNPPLRVSAFTSGGEVPSTRIRVRQYFPLLSSLGISVEEHPSRPNKYTGRPVVLPEPAWTALLAASRAPGLWRARSADVVWFEREFVWRKRTLEHLAGSAARRIFDVDDAIWVDGEPKFSEEIAAMSAGVIAGNRYLAEHYKPFAKKLWIVPTSVDPTRWKPPSQRPSREKFTVGWTGTSGNFRFLLAIEEGLAEFLGRHPDAEVLIIADRPPEWKSLPAAQTRFVRWSERDEVARVHEMDVGLMPLANEEWARGKCAAKMLIYMAAELPVVVSPVGVNAEILAQGDVGYAAETPAQWLDGLEKLYQDRTDARAKAQRGRELVERDYSIDACGRKLAEIFREVARDA